MTPGSREENFTKVAVSGAPFHAEERRAPEKSSVRSFSLQNPNKPSAMNDTTPLNCELLSADARGRKHIPVAVFAVIVIHVVLFLVLLIAAGCRSSARVKRNSPVAPAASVEQRDMTRPPVPDPIAMQQARPVVPPAEAAVVATEPQVEPEPAQTAVSQPARRVTQKTSTPRPTAVKTSVKAPAKDAQKTYVVKIGDTLEKIAKRHGTSIQAVRTANKMKTDTIHPGQKLVVAPENARTAPLQVASR
jgi:LysM repeat protein